MIRLCAVVAMVGMSGCTLLAAADAITNPRYSKNDPEAVEEVFYAVMLDATIIAAIAGVDLDARSAAQGSASK